MIFSANLGSKRSCCAMTLSKLNIHRCDKDSIIAETRMKQSTDSSANSLQRSTMSSSGGGSVRGRPNTTPITSIRVVQTKGIASCSVGLQSTSQLVMLGSPGVSSGYRHNDAEPVGSLMHKRPGAPKGAAAADSIDEEIDDCVVLDDEVDPLPPQKADPPTSSAGRSLQRYEDLYDGDEFVEEEVVQVESPPSAVKNSSSELTGAEKQIRSDNSSRHGRKVQGKKSTGGREDKPLISAPKKKGPSQRAVPSDDAQRRPVTADPVILVSPNKPSPSPKKSVPVVTLEGTKGKPLNNNHNNGSSSSDSNALSINSQQASPSAATAGAQQKRMRVQVSHRALIGKGSFGAVYQAMDRDTNHIIACKEICLVKGSAAVDQVPLIKQELAMLKQLDHPHIVKCLGEDCDDKYLRIYMEFVTGGSISSILRMFGSLQEKQASIFTQQMLEGLEYLHDRHICHRDLKGDNLLVDTFGVLKLADFGTAKELATQTTTIAGTAYFMAPEVIQGVGHGLEADVWSVGCCVIEMVTGKPPFSHLKNQYAIMMHIAEGSRSLDDIIPDELSPDGKSFLRRCLVRNPGERATVKELLAHHWVLHPPEPKDGEERIIDTGSIQLAGQRSIIEAREHSKHQSATTPPQDVAAMNSVNPLAMDDSMEEAY